YDRYRDQGFEIIGLNADEIPQELAFFLTENPMPWATVVTNEAESIGLESPMFRTMGIDAAPFNLLMNREGEVVQLHVYGDELEPAIAGALGIELAEPAGDPSQPPAEVDTGSGSEGSENAEPENAEPADEVEGETENPNSGASGVSLGILSDRYRFVSTALNPQEPSFEEDNPYLAPAHWGTEDLVDFLFSMEDKPRSLQGRAEFVEALVDAADRILEDSEARVAFIRIAGLQKLDALHRMAVMDE
ncbi:MAG: hypothetical protein QF516_16235, partial [Pirellulaceae bacterium]|nr:hypothetical protein [Pirellulaceae bacterium]